MADRAFTYLSTHFFDNQYGGVYWSINADGTPLATTKQIYGQAFALYGLSEYYRIAQSEKALNLAKDLFAYIEKHAFDPQEGGYYEAVGREGQPIEDYILSKAPYIKSMNTHLHLIEAYTNLYIVWPDPVLKQRIKGMLGAIFGHIVGDKTHRMRLFFTKNWTPKDYIISYGHDIEASWLLYETAEVLHDEEVLDWARNRCIAMAKAAATGLGMTLIAGSIPYGVYLFGFLFGAFAFPVNAVSIAHLNDFITEPSDYVEAASGLLLVSAIGSIAGPLVASALIELIGIGTLFAYTAVVHILAAAFCLYRMQIREPAPLEEHIAFSDAFMLAQTYSSVDPTAPPEDEERKAAE